MVYTVMHFIFNDRNVFFSVVMLMCYTWQTKSVQGEGHVVLASQIKTLRQQNLAQNYKITLRAATNVSQV